MTERTPGSMARAPGMVLVIFLLITVLSSRYVWESSRLADRARFNTAVQAATDAVHFRIETYVNVLRAASGLFAANRAATRDQFRSYVQHLRVQERYPGIQGVGLSLRVMDEDLPAVVADLRANEAPRFRVWPETPTRPEYHTIVALEPLDARNQRAIGYDMHTNATRREAMDRARDTGEPACSGRVTLVQEMESSKPPGFLIYVPVYRGHSAPDSVATRREQLYGFVYAPFRASDFFGAMVSPQTRPEVRFMVADGPDLLFDSHPDRGDTPRFRSTTQIPVAGRTWTITFASERTGVGVPLLVTVATALGGLAISFLLFGLLSVQLQARTHAEGIAEQLRDSQAELQQASRAKDEFLATLSHELRTPMTAIMGWSKLLADPLDDQTRASAVEAIQKSARAQAQLIDDLLDVSRITAGKMSIQRSLVELGAIIATAAEAVAPVAESKGVAVRQQEASDPIVVNGDPARLQQIVWNLLSNAVKFTPEGGSIEVSLRREEGEAVLTVADSGQGIEPEFLPYVFERFRQADSSTTRAHSGLGLGLAIVRHLAELHGGRVSAESEGKGRGARFIIRLPVAQESVATGRAQEGAPVAPSLDGVEIVLVDDEESVRLYAETVFRLSRAVLRVAGSAREALAMIEAAPPDIVITDIGMPDMDGFALLRAVRASPEERVSRLPVIALTAYARAEDRESIVEAGFDRLLTKPVEPEPLRSAVAEVLAQPVSRGSDDR